MLSGGPCPGGQGYEKDIHFMKEVMFFFYGC
jgi:hypothetical protein